MSMTDKERDAAIDQGFSEPFESSPIDTPDKWRYRGLFNTGGYTMCRIWQHETKDLELLYNMLADGVTIIGGKWDERKEEYVGNPNEQITTEHTDADELSDTAHAELAKKMMLEYS